MNDELINTVIDEILKEHKIHALWKITAIPEIDGILTLTYKRHKQQFFVRAKKEIREFQLLDILQLAKEHHPFLIVAETLYPKIRSVLTEQGIAYIEINGNINIETENLLLRIEGKRKKILTPEKPGRAFTKTGLKAIFFFLTQDNAINFTYREIAVNAGIAIGNVKLIHEGLIKEGFALRLNENEFKLTNRRELLQKWVTNYTEKLRPTLHAGNFRFADKEAFFNWKNLNLQLTGAQWGGEGAGNIYTDYLQPENLTLYTNATKATLIREYRLLPDQEGNIQVYHRFWKEGEQKNKTVPPIIAYADLMATGNRRCIETAQKIYDQHIAHTIQ